ncbi:MAG: hypothetical protein EHM18_07665 [Acidobacteria bacterium]|nr:MAG: hypothetical protein EHM18_07665 [Acidobacteriota bacterium]
MILVGIDDTDIAGSPGTNQVARALLRRLGETATGGIICRHQLLVDVRVPYTSKNGSASIQLPSADTIPLGRLIDTLRDTMREWFVAGSDPGLCVCKSATPGILAFGSLCKRRLVTQQEALAVASRAECHLEGLGGTEQGVIGALAAVGLVAGGEDGRVVHLSSWPYPDDLSGCREFREVRARGIDEVRLLGSDEPVTAGIIDIGKRLRPNWRNRKIVLYVEPVSGPAPWRAGKLP